MSMDVIDYEIFGDDMQYVEVELDPGEAAVGEAPCITCRTASPWTRSSVMAPRPRAG
ncbi:AIM24 family protein [Paludibacterium denitrificans]|uniref:AIM24 family protein n=1 Tax=Paludibacterium denitrificans TaxID=2675226 RepID=UPI001E527CD3